MRTKMSVKDDDERRKGHERERDGVVKRQRGARGREGRPLSSAAAQQALRKQQQGPAQLCSEWSLSLALRLTTTRRSSGPPHRSVGDRRGRHAPPNSPPPRHTYTRSRSAIDILGKGVRPSSDWFVAAASIAELRRLQNHVSN